jgi:FixJ family two-component response regulator
MSERVFIIDDDEGIRSVLELQAASIGLESESYSQPTRFLEQFSHAGPGCIIADMIMPEMTGLQLLQAAREAHVELPFIILTGHGDVAIAVAAFRMGAFDFLEKPFSKSIFLEIVQRAIQHSRAALDSEAKQRETEKSMALLTGREREVVAEMINGDSNKEIARTLQISHRTVERYRQNLLKKIGVRSVLELGEYVKALSKTSQARWPESQSRFCVK